MKPILLTLLFLFSSLTLFAQTEDLEEGTLIAAKQAYVEGKIKSAMILTSFVLEVNKENLEAQDFVDTIKEKRKIRLYDRFLDKGIGYTDFLGQVIETIPDEEKDKRDFIAFIAKTVNPKSKTGRLSKDNRFEPFYKKYFPNTSLDAPQGKDSKIDPKLISSLRGKRPFHIAREYRLEKLAYNPTKLLTVINEINSQIKHFDIGFRVNNKAIPYEDISDNNGYYSYLGPDLDVTSRPILFRNISLMELIKYLEFTLAVSVKEGRGSLVIDKGLNSRDGRPYYFKHADKLMNEIRQSSLQARAKYDKKSIQLKGYITEIKALSDKLLVEVNNHFVVEVDNKYLKKDTIKNLTAHLKEMKTNPAKAQKYLKVTLRGIVAIKTVSRTFITNCDSLIAEEAPFFYTTF